MLLDLIAMLLIGKYLLQAIKDYRLEYTSPYALIVAVATTTFIWWRILV